MGTIRYEYWMKPLRVIDGDTLVVEVDLGFSLYKQAQIRLINVDTHEINGPKHEQAIKEESWTKNWLKTNDDSVEEYPFILETFKKPDSFGRYLGRIWSGDRNRCLNRGLRLNFDNVEWDG